MNRKQFLRAITTLGITGAAMQLPQLRALTDSLPATPKMPVLFLGHGSPMNAIEDNEFVQEFRKLGREIPRPAAVVCVSAHWETNGTQVTAMDQPRTIHDFGGFPRALHEVSYPAPGSPALAGEVRELLSPVPVGTDVSWGLDHGAWSVLIHLFPKADVPIIQLSLDRRKSPAEHYALARELGALRKKGVLIVGSGNMVHNLRRVAFDKIHVPNYAFDWALEAKNFMEGNILKGDHQQLINYRAAGQAVQLAVPTPEHYLPLLYTLALREKDEPVQLFNDKAIAGSLTMTSVRVG